MLHPATCVLVRDLRFPVGGFESWVETLAAGLPQHQVPTVVLVVTEEAKVPPVIAARCSPAMTQSVLASPHAPEQAAYVVAALEQLARDGRSGIFFTMGYPYINMVGVNLRGSPFVAVPVMHGRDPGAFDWACMGPPPAIVSPSTDYAEICRDELSRRVGRWRACRRVVSIPHGVAVPDPELLRAKWNRPPAVPLQVIAVSRLDDHIKRPWDYVRVAEELHRRELPAHLTVHGVGSCFEAMQQQAELLHDHLTVAGPIAREELYSRLLESDVLLSTSESEAFGLAVAEGLICGNAVVAADIPGPVREMVQPRTGFSVPVGDVVTIVDRLAMLCERPELVRQLGRAGHDYVRQHFPEATMLAAYARLARRVGRRMRPGPRWRAAMPLKLSPGEALPPGIFDGWPLLAGVRGLVRRFIGI